MDTPVELARYIRREADNIDRERQMVDRSIEGGGFPIAYGRMNVLLEFVACRVEAFDPASGLMPKSPTWLCAREDAGRGDERCSQICEFCRARLAEAQEADSAG